MCGSGQPVEINRIRRGVLRLKKALQLTIMMFPFAGVHGGMIEQVFAAGRGAGSVPTTTTTTSSRGFGCLPPLACARMFCKLFSESCFSVLFLLRRRRESIFGCLGTGVLIAKTYRHIPFVIVCPPPLDAPLLHPGAPTAAYESAARALPGVGRAAPSVYD